jgi:hypothetical protein
MDALYQRLDQIEKQIGLVKNKQARKDLLKMVRTVDAAMVAADMESVECRRLHRKTPRYKELVKTAGDLIANLEQHLTLAILMGG